MDRTVTVWNPASERIFGWTAEEVLGKPMPAAMTPDDERETSARRVARTIAGEATRGDRVRRLTKDGREVWIEIYGAVLRDPEGRPIGVAGQLADVTERVALEAQLAHAERLEAIGRLAGGIAHDFNNTLTAIGGFASLIEGEAEDRVAVREDAATIVDIVERSGQLTRQLLAFARRTTLLPTVVDIRTAVRTVEPTLHRLLDGRIDLTVRGSDEALVARVDAGQLEQALVNLALNARDAMDEGGRVLVSMRRVRVAPGDVADDPDLAGAFVAVAVCDTGTGMDATVAGQAFEPFFTTKEPGRGTGLGLAMVRDFARQSGGTVRLASTPGTGTTVELLFPEVAGTLVEDDAAPAERTREPRDRVRPARGRRSRRRGVRVPDARRSRLRRAGGERQGGGAPPPRGRCRERSTSSSPTCSCPTARAPTSPTRSAGFGRASRRCSCAGTRPTPWRSAACAPRGWRCSPSRTTVSSSPHASGESWTRAPGRRSPRRPTDRAAGRPRRPTGAAPVANLGAVPTLGGVTLPNQEERWREMLSPDNPSAIALRRVFRRIPSPPRCKMCHAPFKGVGGFVLRPWFGPWEKNPQLCKSCIGALAKQGPGGAEIELSLLFADIRGSTAIGERLRPAEFSALLHAFYRIAAQAITDDEGIVDKFVGDEAIGLFIPGFAGRDHAAKAIAAGRALLAAVARRDASPTARSRWVPGSTPGRPMSAASARATRSRTSPRSATS